MKASQGVAAVPSKEQKQNRNQTIEKKDDDVVVTEFDNVK